MSLPLPAGLGQPLLSLLSDPPLDPSRDQAQRWAVEELAKREYAEQRPGAVQQLLDWLLSQIGRLQGPVDAGTGTAFALVVGAVLVLVAVAAVVAGRTLRRPRTADPWAIFDAGTGTAAGHREAADAAAARGDWRTAVVERFRAVVRELEERAVLVPAPGRTAHEAAEHAAGRLPDQAGALQAAARLFDDVRYGDRPASDADDGSLRRLDEQVRAARVAV
jgi:hypothetical protein